MRRVFIKGPVIDYKSMRTNKPLAEITAADIPRGFWPEDVCRSEDVPCTYTGPVPFDRVKRDRFAKEHGTPYVRPAKK